MTAPIATAGMLIRRPPQDVFEAFADPAQTTRFWFTDSTGRLEAGARVRWTWAMYGAGTDVRVKAIEPARRILIDWDTADSPTEVEWTFAPLHGGTWVEVVNRGFGEGDQQVAKALDSAGGFALVLGGAKIWLEHGIDPRFVEDRHPQAYTGEWRQSHPPAPLEG